MMRKRLRITLAAAALPFLALLGCLGILQLYGNFHEVIPGELYRSAQPSPAQLKKYVADYDIKTIIFLRSDKKTSALYKNELKAAHEAGAKLIQFPMSASVALKKEQSDELLKIFDTVSKPILLHCRSGADRTGFATAFYLGIYKKMDEMTAEMQISPIYGHMAALGLSTSFAMDETWEAAEEWYGIEKGPHSHWYQPFANWHQFFES